MTDFIKVLLDLLSGIRITGIYFRVQNKVIKASCEFHLILN